MEASRAAAKAPPSLRVSRPLALDFTLADRRLPVSRIDGRLWARAEVRAREDAPRERTCGAQVRARLTRERPWLVVAATAVRLFDGRIELWVSFLVIKTVAAGTASTPAKSNSI